MSSKIPTAILKDYENSLFIKSQTEDYIFKPNHKIDAEYFYHNLTYSLFEMEAVDLPYAELVIKGLRLDDPKRLLLPEVKKSMREMLEKLEAIKSWYGEQNLEMPQKIDPFADLDVWEAMVDGFWERVKTRYEEGLAEVRKKFSQIEIDRKDIKQIDSPKKEDWPDAIYTLADELRLRKDQGKCETYKEAWEYGVKHWTVNGEPVTYEQLERNYYKAKSTGKL